MEGYSTGLSSYNNNGVIVLYLLDGSYVQATSNSGQIKNIYSDYTIVNHNENSGNIIGCEFKQGFNGTISLTQSVYHQYCSYAIPYSGISIESFTFPNNISYSGKSIQIGKSTFDVDLPVSGSSISLFSYAGIVHIIKNEEETEVSVDNFQNMPRSFPIRFIPQNDLSVEFIGTSISSISNGKLILPTSTFTANGSTYDWIEFESERQYGEGQFFCKQIDAMNYI